MDVGSEMLTAEDVASILHVSKSTVYNLVRQGNLHAHSVGRKLRFTRKSVDDYIAWTATQQAAPRGKDKTPSFRSWLEKQEHIKSSLTICGHDVILDVLANYLNLSGIPTDRAYVSSYEGLIMLYRGEAQVAAVHMWDAQTNQYNEPFVRQLLPGVPTVTIRLATRVQGFCVAPQNPKAIKTWTDLTREDVRYGNRSLGTGSRILLDGHLSLLGIDPSNINGYEHEFSSSLEMAEAVAQHAIDVGVGSQSMIAQIENVDFIPLQKEEYDLVIRQDIFKTPEAQALLHVIRSLPFKKHFNGISGYETSQMGRLVIKTQ